MKDKLNAWFKNFIKKSKMFCPIEEEEKFENTFKSIFGDGIGTFVIDSSPVSASMFSVYEFGSSSEVYMIFKHKKFEIEEEMINVGVSIDISQIRLYSDIYDNFKRDFGFKNFPMFVSYDKGKIREFSSEDLYKVLRSEIENKPQKKYTEPYSARVKIIGVFLDSYVRSILDKDGINSSYKVIDDSQDLKLERSSFIISENPVDEKKRIHYVMETSKGTHPTKSEGLFFFPVEYLKSGSLDVKSIPYFYIFVSGINMNLNQLGLSLADIPPEYLPPPTNKGIKPDGSVDVDLIKGIIRGKYFEVMSDKDSEIMNYFSEDDAYILAEIESSFNPNRLRWNFTAPNDRSIGLYQVTLGTFAECKRLGFVPENLEPRVMYDPEISAEIAFKYLKYIFSYKIKPLISKNKIPSTKNAVVSALFCGYNRGPGYIFSSVKHIQKYGMTPCYHWWKYINVSRKYGINVTITPDFSALLESVKQKELSGSGHSGKVVTA